MTDPTLAEVAADVAKALGYDIPVYNYARAVIGWSAERRYGIPASIYADGSNLTDPYWRCACEDWLHAQGWYFAKYRDWAECYLGAHESYRENNRVPDGTPWPEAPARLVSAVWRRMNAVGVKQ